MGMHVVGKIKLSKVHGFLLEKKGDKDIFEYGDELWNLSLQHKPTLYWLLEAGKGSSMLDTFYKNSIIAIGWDSLGDLNQYNSRQDIANALNEINDTSGSRKNDRAANYEFSKIMSIGDIVIIKDGFSKYLGYAIVDSDYYFDDDSLEYKHRRKVKWVKQGEWTNSETITISKTLTNITNKPYCSKLIDLLAISKPNQSKAEKMKEQEINILKLNTILCGPPGTGKTYKMQNEYAPLFTEKERVISKGDFSSAMIKDLTWWEVIALVLYQNGKMEVKELLNHPYTRIKASYSNAKTPNNTLWGELQRRTKLDCEYVKCSTSRQEPQVFEKDQNGYWFIDKDEFAQACPNLIDIISEINDYEENISNILHYKFITFHQKYSYEDFIIGITPTLKGEANNSGLSFELKTGVFYNCCVEALRLAGYDNFRDCYEDSKENREKKFTNTRKFAIFIDEINRANISSVFGELITCIEDTKRLGRENELWVDLPLEGGMFGVPSNLYIIGTMNTADRSIALIDVALRRRFDFKRIYPDIDVFSEEESWAKNLLSTLNNLIYEEKRSADFLIGHTYFLGKEEADKKDIFDNNIIPLLYEYFQNNTDKVQSILENCGLNVQMGKDYLLTLVSENNG